MRLWITVTGALLLTAGLFWPWIGKVGFGHLPGDLWIRGERFSFYFPITTCIIASLVFSFVFWLLNR